MSNRTIETKDGVTVIKDVVVDGLPMPAIRFACTSERSSPAAIRLIEHIPEEVDVSDIGFHKEYDKESWRTDGDRQLAYERIIEPGERILTVYFIRNADINLQEFEGAVQLEHVVPVDDDAALANEVPVFRGSTAVDTPIGDDMTVAPVATDGLGDKLRGDQDEEQPVLELNDPVESDVDADDEWESTRSEEDFVESPSDIPLQLNDEEDTSSEPLSASASADEPLKFTDIDDSDPAEETDASISSSVENQSASEENQPSDEVSPGPTRADPTSVDAAAFQEFVDEAVASSLDDIEQSLQEFIQTSVEDAVTEKIAQNESIDTETLQNAIRAELEANPDNLIPDHDDDGVPGHLEARIKRVEGEYNELAAYTDALREFLDEKGSASDVLEDVQCRLDTLENLNAELGSEVGTVTDQLADIDDNISDRVSDIETAVDEHDEHLGKFQDSIGSLDDRMAQLADRIADIDASMERLWYHRNTVVESFESIAASLGADPADFNVGEDGDDEVQ